MWFMVLLTTQENVIEDVNLQKQQNSKDETDAKWKAQFSVTTQAWRKLLCFLGACRLHKQKGESSDLSPYNISLTKLVWSRWLDSAQHFFRFMDLDFVLVHKRANIELGQYQAIFLTSRSGNSSYKATVQKWRRTGLLLEHMMHVLNPKAGFLLQNLTISQGGD